MAKHPAKRRGRPTPGRVAVINLEILHAARAMFLDEGYSAISMEAVANRAGVSKGTLYARFPSKAALFKAVVEERTAVWAADAAKDYRAKDKSLKGRVEHFAATSLDKLATTEIRAFTFLYLTEFRDSPEVARIYYDISFAIGIDLLISEIEAGAAEDGVTIPNARALAMALLEMLWGWLSFQLLQGQEPSKAARHRAAKKRAAILLAAQGAW
jgi:AcrR family transcriptional regulator